MKKTNKGFTIVELVIVIAVIAILAAVLIPTFSGVVANANASAALQTARSTLSSALNMSSTGALAGETAQGIMKTVFCVDGYAFNYQGNQLEAIDYPGAASVALLRGGKGASAKDLDKTYNFNAILIASQNLKKVITDYAVADPQPNVNNFGQQTYYTKNSDDEYTEATEFAQATADANGYFVVKTAEYTLDESISKTIDGASNIHLKKDTSVLSITEYAGHYYLEFAFTYAETSDTAAVSGKKYYTRSGEGTEESPYVYTETASFATGVYERTGYDYTAEVFVNSDFSKKVVVFTTFG